MVREGVVYIHNDLIERRSKLCVSKFGEGNEGEGDMERQSLKERRPGDDFPRGR